MDTTLIWETISRSPDETIALGQLLGEQLEGQEVIELRSDLGGGKTAFVKGLVRGAGSHHSVTSPTFTLSRIYPTPKFVINHFDFYRLTDAGIMAEQLAESLAGNQAVTVVEWADVVKDILPAERISIELQPIDANPNERRLIFSYPASKRHTIAAIETKRIAVEP